MRKKFINFIAIFLILGSQNADTGIAAAADFEDFEEWESESLEAENPSNGLGVMDGLDGNFFSENPGRIYLEPQFLDGDLLKLAVIAEDIASPVIGLAFHLNYDPENIAFLRYDPGEFLEKGGDPFYLVKDDKKNHKIIFGETLRRDDRFPIGEDMVAEFYFQILNWNKFAFRFEKGVVSTLDTVRQDLETVNFEDLFLDKDFDERLEGTFEIDAGSLGDRELEASGFAVSKSYGILFLIIAAAGTALFLGFLIKKQEKKRQAQSVNFK